MNSFLYLYWHTFRNRLKKALKKVSTYILVIIIGAYAVFLIGAIGGMVEALSFDTPQRLAVVVSFAVIYLLPANLVSYSKRKGLIFKPADHNFVFQSPCSPKKILLYAHFKTVLLSLVFGIVLTIMGILYFHVSIGTMLMYFFFCTILENILEAALMILFYGNERFGRKTMRIFNLIMYGFMAAFAVICIIILYINGISFDTFEQIIGNPVVQLIPIIGWNIAIIRLLFIGSTLLNVICACLFFIATILLVMAAWKMKCTGEYFEDAAKFADDYAEAKKRGKKGEAVRIGKKKTFKAADIMYKGVYAKAIYYRQMLEYKKNKTFIFDKNTVVSMIVGVGIAVFAYHNDFAGNMGDMKIFVIPGVMAYVLFIFSGYITKWGKELENPYTYLIPDSSIHKMWYATKIEHIRSLIDGCFMVIPGAIIMKLSILQIILLILVYVCLTANRLYLTMLADALIGNRLGQFGRNLVKLLFQGIVIGIAIILAATVGLFFGTDAAFMVMILATAGLTMAGAVVAATSFEQMEAVD